MRIVLLPAAALLSSLLTGRATAAVNVEDGGLSIEQMVQFQNWAEFHGKSYDSHEEKMTRLQIWLNNDGAYCLQCTTGSSFLEVQDRT